MRVTCRGSQVFWGVTAWQGKQFFTFSSAIQSMPGNHTFFLSWSCLGDHGELGLLFPFEDFFGTHILWDLLSFVVGHFPYVSASRTKLSVSSELDSAVRSLRSVTVGFASSVMNCIYSPLQFWLHDSLCHGRCLDVVTCSQLGFGVQAHMSASCRRELSVDTIVRVGLMSYMRLFRIYREGVCGQLPRSLALQI